MAIPESQLDTWSHQGSVQQSSTTYQTIRSALLTDDSGYAKKSFEVFLQGSYGNDTNIYAESDVDIVIRTDSIFRGNNKMLSADEQAAYDRHFSDSTYTFKEFKDGVYAALVKRFGSKTVKIGNKAIKISGDTSRRDVDVVVCYQYRYYEKFKPSNPDDFTPGIIFPTASGEIINYPKTHSDNLTEKHQATGKMLKPMVRILKNMRSKMVEDGALSDGVAPSYYIEGLFYNVPPDQYVASSYGDTFCNGINWLEKCDKSKLVCANWQYYLLGNSNVQWNSTDLAAFLTAVCKLWNNW